jgi:hypothetical protein
VILGTAARDGVHTVKDRPDDAACGTSQAEHINGFAEEKELNARVARALKAVGAS